MNEIQDFELRCDACTWHRLCGPVELEKQLRAAGHFRRSETPSPELVRELLLGVAPQLNCPDCGAAGLKILLHEEEDDWATARRCEVCRQPISPERLEAFPSALRCLNCQRAEESGESKTELEYCARCGSLLELRVSQRSGITQYKLFCTGNPPCRT